MAEQTTRPFVRFFSKNFPGAGAHNRIGGWTRALKQRRQSVGAKAVDVVRGWVDRQYGMAQSDLVGYALFKGLSMLPIPMVDDLAMAAFVKTVRPNFSIPNKEAHRLMKLLAVRGVPERVRVAGGRFLANKAFYDAVRRMDIGQVQELRRSVYAISSSHGQIAPHANALIAHIDRARNGRLQFNRALQAMRRAPPRLALAR